MQQSKLHVFGCRNVTVVRGPYSYVGY